MKFIQVVNSLSIGDAVGNDILAIRKALTEEKYENVIYAEHIHAKLENEKGILSEMPKVEPEDIVIYHLATGTELNYELGKMKCKKVVRYHNITPPHFFTPYSQNLVDACAYGYAGTEYLSDKFDFALADSEYNAQELRRMGYSCPIDVVPILIPLEDYEKKPSQETLRTFQDCRTNIMFCGRVVPNKKHQDIIAAFYHYKKRYDPTARLLLVGATAGMEAYYQKLAMFAHKNGVGQDVIFIGSCSFSSILAYYKMADIFLCMSDHEGFCVPLVEAMKFGVPIVAKDTSAIAGTLGGSGVLLPDASPAAAAQAMWKIKSDENYRNALIEGEKKRLSDFAYDRVKAQLMQALEKVIKLQGGYCEKENSIH